MSQAQFTPMDMAGLMSTFNIPFRPDAAAAPTATSTALPMMPAQQPQPPLAMNPQSIAPSDLFGHIPMTDVSMLNQPAFVAEPMSFAGGFSGGSFGSLGWPTTSSMQSTWGPQPMPRNTSYSSTDSEPYIKSEEDSSPILPSQIFNDISAYNTSDSASVSESEDKPAVFSTDIDVLMRAIQAKTQPNDQKSVGVSKPASPPATQKSKKRYHCEVLSCGKSFCQKTHLDIHTRAHTGVKPFVCKEPTCGQRFSQLGNLKTHERRHTGERPYHCDICGKTFAQHGNVRAHKIVHTSAKPFTCKLDSCNKQFTQLGNLKSHQNKFHVGTIRRLKSRFESIKEGDVVESWEKEMWEYFAGLYKNCNKGIKGRGKDRRISNTSLPSAAASRRGSLVGTTSVMPRMEMSQPIPPQGLFGSIA